MLVYGIAGVGVAICCVAVRLNGWLADRCVVMVVCCYCDVVALLDVCCRCFPLYIVCVGVVLLACCWCVGVVVLTFCCYAVVVLLLGCCCVVVLLLFWCYAVVLLFCCWFVVGVAL